MHGSAIPCPRTFIGGWPDVSTAEGQQLALACQHIYGSHRGPAPADCTQSKPFRAALHPVGDW